MDENQILSKLSVQDVIDHIDDGVMVTDKNKIVVAVNPSFCHTSGYTPAEIIGLNCQILEPQRSAHHFYHEMWEAVEQMGFWSGKTMLQRQDGKIISQWLSIRVAKNKLGQTRNLIIVLSGLNGQKHKHHSPSNEVFFDPLTGLPSRTYFSEQCRLAISNAALQNSKLAVLFIDLDRVKIINNTLGHDVGDLLLQAVAERIKTCLRPTDSVFRLGGDEFTVLLGHFDNHNAVYAITQKLLNALKPSFYLRGHDVYTSASIGITFFPEHGSDSLVLCRNAETAMYRAKRLGRNNFQVFTSQMKDEMFEELSLGNHLRRALEKEEFVLHYQPQLNMSSGDIIGVEALIRWNHPKFGLVSPSRFIHWAEDSGFIIPLGEWVLRNACYQAKRWHDMGYKHLNVAVNLSARQFEEDNLVKTVFRILEETEFNPSALDLELTESLLVEQSESLKSIPFELQKVGVRFSIDDFGKGYSSLSYLKHFPAQTLKVDQSFVQDVTQNSDDAAIASAVVNLGHSLDLTVLAEGIETDGQLEFFRSLNCDKVQGFLLSKPLAASDIDIFLKNQPHYFFDPLFAPRNCN